MIMSGKININGLDFGIGHYGDYNKTGEFHPKYGRVYIWGDKNSLAGYGPQDEGKPEDPFVKKILSEPTYYTLKTGVGLCNEDLRFEEYDFPVCELLTFISKLILPEYILYEDRTFLEEDYIYAEFNYRKLYFDNEEFKKEIDFLANRLSRLHNPDFIFDIKKVPEFLLVDEYTSFAPNFREDDGECCSLSFGHKDRTEVSGWQSLMGVNSLFDVPSGIPIVQIWSAYDLPEEYQKAIIKDSGDMTPRQSASNVVYNWTPQQKTEYFKNLPTHIKHDLFVETLRMELRTFEEGNYMPYFVYLGGNDDDSWTKYFHHEEDMLKELEYLLRIAPINKRRDVYERDYVFTN